MEESFEFGGRRRMLTGKLGRNRGPEDSDWMRRAASDPRGDKEVLRFKNNPKSFVGAD